MHFCPIFFEHCVKKPNHWFYLCKKCTIKMCIFIQKRHMSFGKKPQLIKWFNLLLLKPTPPQNVLYKPRLFYSKVSSHSKITPPTGATTTTTRSPPAWGLATIKRRRRTQKSTRALVFVRSTSWSGLSWTILNKGCGA